MTIGRSFTVPQAAAYLAAATGRQEGEKPITPESVRRAFRAGWLAGSKDPLRVGSPIRFTQAQLDDYLDWRRQRAVVTD